MANYFIKHPVFAIVISIVITLLGIVSAVNLPIAQYPKISPPTISVSANYAGANADVVNQTIAQVIEDQVNGVEGMLAATIIGVILIPVLFVVIEEITGKKISH